MVISIKVQQIFSFSILFYKLIICTYKYIINLQKFLNNLRRIRRRVKFRLVCRVVARTNDNITRYVDLQMNLFAGPRIDDVYGPGHSLAGNRFGRQPYAATTLAGASKRAAIGGVPKSAVVGRSPPGKSAGADVRRRAVAVRRRGVTARARRRCVRGDRRRPLGWWR